MMMKQNDEKTENKTSIEIKQDEKNKTKNGNTDFFTIFHGEATQTPKRYCSDESLILFLLSGDMQLTDSKGVTTKLRASQCVFMPKNVPVKIEISNHTTVIAMRFSYRTFTPDGPEVWEDCSTQIEHCTHPVLDVAPLMTTVLEGIIQPNGLLKSPNYQRIKAEEIHETARLCYSNHQRSWFCQSIVRPQDDFKAFVEAHCDRIKNSMEMAKTVGMSESTFRKLFRKTFGEPFRIWLMKQKIARMTQLIEAGEQNNKRLMDELGYVNKLSYIRFCKQWMGGNPAEIIKRRKENNEPQGS